MIKSYIERIFVHKKDIDSIRLQQDGATCHTAEATLDVLRPVFEDNIISRSANVVWPPRSCADNPETIDTLKDNIREAIGDI